MNSPAKQKRRYLRFGLIELLILIAVVAAWLPTFIAMRRIPELESKVQLYRSFTSDLERVDPNQLCARKLRSLAYGTGAFKYFLPEGAEMELRLATEQISGITLPSQYDSAKLPEGEHRIYLREFDDVNKDYVKQVYVDDEVVLTSRHPKSWLDSNGSSWSNNVGLRSEAYPLTEPLELKNARFSINYPGVGHRNYGRVPDEYDAKGCCLWIAPSDHVSEPAPNFISPRTPKVHRQAWGHRQGIRIGDFNSNDSPGLIPLFAGFEATVGNNLSRSNATNALSVRPIVDAGNDENVEMERAELPELQQSHVNGQPGLRIGLSKTLITPHWNKPSPLESPYSLGEISQNGKTMRIFCHYENYLSGFASGAMPIIETIFDADHPNRIGLLPHQAADSKPIEAIQIVTTMDARFRRRRVDLIVDGGEVETVPLLKQKKPVGKSSVNSQSADAADVWQTIELTEIPVDQSAQMRKLRFSTDVKNFSKAKLPATVDPKWNYDGIPNCQTWWLPLSDLADLAFKVEVLQTDEALSEGPPPAPVAIPGGPVIKSVRITIPMPATKPIWLEITPDPQ